MTATKFSPAPPPPVVYAFSCGVLRIAWTGETYAVAGRSGVVYAARISECHTPRNSLKRDDVNAALLHVIVIGPAGALYRIAGVESHCTAILRAGDLIGLLLVAVDR